MFKANFCRVGRKGRSMLVGLGVLVTLMVLSGGTFSSSSAMLDEDIFVKVAEEVGRSVVSITAVQTETVPYVDPFEQFFGENFFEHFFESPQRPYRREAPKPRERTYQYPVLGSGVIINEEGYILTNEHVIHNAVPDKITIKLPDGRELSGKVTGSDPRSDLAIVKVKGKNLPAARLGDSDKLKIGQWVIAIGNPFGFLLNDSQPTLTVGVISALNRSLSGTLIGQGRFYEGLIQTDAAINQGNSGGPLVNLKGEVIGINMAIFSTSGGSQGIGFAIPINTAQRIIEDLIGGKKIIYGWLGVGIQDLNPDLAGQFGLSSEQKGVLVASVFKDGPAEKAGFKQGDVITEVKNREIKTASELMGVIGRMPAGQRVEVKILRDGKEMTLTAEVGERPSEPEELVREKGWRGMRVTEIVDLPDREGVFVSEVEMGSPAYEAGLREGNVIGEINRKRIKNLEDYQKVIGEIKAEEDVLIHADRGYTIIRGEK